jgi:hypothetical protein
MRNLILICALGLSIHTLAQDTQITITDYLKGISSEPIAQQELVGSWVVNSTGFSGEVVEIHANGKAYLHYKSCQGKVREQVEVALNGIELVVKDSGSVYFRKSNGKVQFFNQLMAKELCALFYKGLCEREELMAKLESCWLDVSSRA